MKVVIADTGALISLIHLEKFDLIEKVFGDFFIAKAVWKELNDYDNPDFDRSYLQKLESKVKQINSRNYLLMTMDSGEAESVILYEELDADYLLIDDNKARAIAESLDVNCIGTLGLLIKAKQKGLIRELKPLFKILIGANRYFSKKLLNDLLHKMNETEID